jgi:hypothetical protein
MDSKEERQTDNEKGENLQRECSCFRVRLPSGQAKTRLIDRPHTFEGGLDDLCSMFLLLLLLLVIILVAWLLFSLLLL